MSHYPAIAAGLFSAAAWGVASLLFARFLRDHKGDRPPSPAGANLFKNSLALICFLAIWPLMGGGLPDSNTMVWLLISGALGFALGDSLYFAALPRCGVQTTAMVGQLNVPMAAFFAYAFKGEALSAMTMIGMGLSMGGVLLVLSDPVLNGGKSRATAFRAGIFFALLHALSIASGIFVGHVGIEDVGIMPGTIVRIVGGILGAFMVAPLWGYLARRLGDKEDSAIREVKAIVEPFKRRDWWKALALASFAGSVVGLIPYHMALRDLHPGVSAAMFSTTPLFTLMLSRAFGERFGPRAALGTLVGFGGVLLVLKGLAPA
ncbi:MAG: drug/metabolite transporter (DMT)-like permease [Planctomycetota bacterium]